MNERLTTERRGASWPQGEPRRDEVDVRFLIGALRRQIPVIAGATMAGAILGLLYALTASPQFTASTRLLVEPSLLRTGGSLDGSAHEAAMAGEVALLWSDKVAGDVVAALDPGALEVLAPRPGVLSRAKAAVMSLLPGPGPQEDAASQQDRERRRQIEGLHANMSAERAAGGNLIAIGFTSLDAAVSANVVRALLAAYFTDKRESAETASDAILAEYDRQIAAVRTRLDEAIEAVERFRDSAGPTGPTALAHLQQMTFEVESYRDGIAALIAAQQGAIKGPIPPQIAVRVIDPVAEPVHKSAPNRPLVLALGVLAGAFAGVAGALARELRDTSPRTPAQVRRAAGCDVVAMLPPDAGDDANTEAQTRLRALKFDLDDRRSDTRTSSLGFLPQAGAGGAEVVDAYGGMLARAGARVLLVDADLRLSAGEHPGQRAGLSEVLLDAAELRTCISSDGPHAIGRLGAGRAPADAAAGLLLDPSRLGAVIDEARSAYDFVLLRLPAGIAAAEARAVAQRLDGIVAVARWGVPWSPEFRRSLIGLSALLLGVVMTDVHIARLRSYEA